MRRRDVLKVAGGGVALWRLLLAALLAVPFTAVGEQSVRLIADFTTGTWPEPATVAQGGTTLITDATAANAGTRTYSRDENGIKIAFESGTTSQYASISYRPTTPMNLTGQYLAIEFEYPEGTGAFYDSIVMFITEETENTGVPATDYVHYMNKTYQPGADKMPHRLVTVMNFGESWALTNGGPAGVPYSMSSIGKIDIRLVISASAQNYPAHVYIRKIWVGGTKPAVLFTFADAYSAQLSNAAVVLAAAGMKGNLVASSSYIGDGGKLSLTDVGTLYNTYEWDVGLQQTDDIDDILVNFAPSASGLSCSGDVATWNNISAYPHLLTNGQDVTVRGAMDSAWNATWGPITVVDSDTFTFAATCAGKETPVTGFVNTDRLTAAEITAIIDAEQAYWASAGYTRGNHAMAYAGGVVADSALDAITVGGVSIGHTSYSGTTPMQYFFDPRISTARSMLMLPASTMDQTTAATQLARVQSAQSRGGIIILTGHDQQPGVGTGTALTMDTAEFQTLVDGVKAMKDRGLVDVITFTELQQRLGTLVWRNAASTRTARQ